MASGGEGYESLTPTDSRDYLAMDQKAETKDGKHVRMEGESEDTKQEFTPAPRDLICPEPLPRAIADDESTMFFGSLFHPVLHQSRRDMYGGDLRKGIPKGFQNILYDISNAVIKENNYGKTHPHTKKVFNGKQDMYEFIARYIDDRLTQRNEFNGKKKGEH